MFFHNHLRFVIEVTKTTVREASMSYGLGSKQ